MHNIQPLIFHPFIVSHILLFLVVLSPRPLLCAPHGPLKLLDLLITQLIRRRMPVLPDVGVLDLADVPNSSEREGLVPPVLGLPGQSRKTRVYERLTSHVSLRKLGSSMYFRRSGSEMSHS
jgi:hypothetical protein